MEHHGSRPFLTLPFSKILTMLESNSKQSDTSHSHPWPGLIGILFPENLRDLRYTLFSHSMNK